MSDTAIQKAEKHKATLEARKAELQAKKLDIEYELAFLEDELKETGSFIKAWHRFEAIDPGAVPEPMFKPSNTVSLGRKAASNTNPKKEFVAEWARKILVEKGAPLSRAELFKELGERGITLAGNDPEKVLSTMLWRMSHVIKRVDPYGYWIAGQPLPSTLGPIPKTDRELFEEEDRRRPKKPEFDDA